MRLASLYLLFFTRVLPTISAIVRRSEDDATIEAGEQFSAISSHGSVSKSDNFLEMMGCGPDETDGCRYATLLRRAKSWKSIELSQGSKGKVYEVVRLKDGKHFAWTTFTFGQRTEADMDDYMIGDVKRALKQIKTLVRKCKISHSCPYTNLPIDVHPEVAMQKRDVAQVADSTIRLSNTASGYVSEIKEGNFDQYRKTTYTGLNGATQAQVLQTFIYQMFWACMGLQGKGYQHTKIFPGNILYTVNNDPARAKHSPVDFYLVDLTGVASIDLDTGVGQTTIANLAGSREGAGMKVPYGVDLEYVASIVQSLYNAEIGKVVPVLEEFAGPGGALATAANPEERYDHFVNYVLHPPNGFPNSLGPLPETMTEADQKRLLALAQEWMPTSNKGFDVHSQKGPAWSDKDRGGEEGARGGRPPPLDESGLTPERIANLEEALKFLDDDDSDDSEFETESFSRVDRALAALDDGDD